MAAGDRLKGSMDRPSSAGRANGKPGLDPREALDILDIRTGKPGGTAELAVRTDAGPDVLHYLAVHGAPATRQAVAANPAAPALTNRLLADDECEDVRAEFQRLCIGAPGQVQPGDAGRETEVVFDA